MEEIKADSQAMLFMPGPTQRNILENFVKTRKGYLKSEKITERKGGEIKAITWCCLGTI